MSAARPSSRSVAVPAPAEGTGWVGKSIPTKEAVRFTTGHGSYLDDVKLE